jgi:hypothetical protein
MQECARMCELGVHHARICSLAFRGDGEKQVSARGTGEVRERDCDAARSSATVGKREIIVSDVTRVLGKIEAGGPSAGRGELLPLVYEELRKLAAARLTQEDPARRCRLRHGFMRPTGSCRSFTISAGAVTT